MAVWQTRLGGLKWLDQLAADGKAIDLGGNGYPNRYTATAEQLIPSIVNGPPEARAVWGHDAGDIRTERWEGKTVIDNVIVESCSPIEWLIVEAWDES